MNEYKTAQLSYETATAMFTVSDLCVGIEEDNTIIIASLLIIVFTNATHYLRSISFLLHLYFLFHCQIKLSN